MERYLIDTNVISDYFSASLPAIGLQFMDSVIDAVPDLSVKSIFDCARLSDYRRI